MTEHVQVAVVGAGPAGLAAATAAANAGAAVAVFDEGDEPGGQLRYRRGPFAGPDGVLRSGAELAGALTASAQDAGVHIAAGTSVWGAFPGLQLGVRSKTGSRTVRADRILLSTGSTDRATPFPGGSLPGVFTARALLKLVNLYGVLPGGRYAVVGAGEQADEIQADILAAGGEVVFVAETPSGVSASGARGVRSVSFAGVTHAVDMVVTAAGRQADFTMAQMAECALGFDAAEDRFLPALSGRLESSVPGLYLAGDAAGVTSVEVACAEGVVVGLHVAVSLGLPIDKERLAAAEASIEGFSVDRSESLRRRAASFDQIDRALVGSPR